MIRSVFAACFSLVIAASLVGCGNSPESMCKKFTELEKKAGKEKKEEKDSMDKCVKDLNEMKEKNPKQYECASPCADKGTYDEAFTCFTTCIKDNPDAKK